MEAVDLEKMVPDVKESLEDVKESLESEADQIPEAHERFSKKPTKLTQLPTRSKQSMKIRGKQRGTRRPHRWCGEGIRETSAPLTCNACNSRNKRFCIQAFDTGTTVI